MLFVRFLTVTERPDDDPCRLLPAPSVTDWEEIKASLEGLPPAAGGESLVGTTGHGIRSTYRGWLMYLYPGTYFYRPSPKSNGGHGLAGTPLPGTQEEVELFVNGLSYKATVEFCVM
jgi:hypothetical protein